MNWTPEPWQRVYGRPKAMKISLADYDRAVDCVNALARIEDPAEFKQGIINALCEIERETVAIQFKQDERPEFHLRRIKQLVRAAIQSTIAPSAWEVQEPALSMEQP